MYTIWEMGIVANLKIYAHIHDNFNRCDNTIVYFSAYAKFFGSELEMLRNITISIIPKHSEIFRCSIGSRLLAAWCR